MFLTLTRVNVIHRIRYAVTGALSQYGRAAFDSAEPDSFWGRTGTGEIGPGRGSGAADSDPYDQGADPLRPDVGHLSKMPGEHFDCRPRPCETVFHFDPIRWWRSPCRNERRLAAG
jgi:hypothetical protein